MYKYTNNFLKNLGSHEQKLIKGQLDNIMLPNMEERLDKWLTNFRDRKEKELALKIFLNIEYFNYNRIEKILELYKIILKQYLQGRNKELDDIIIVISENNIDSMNYHVYNLVKKWNISPNSILTSNELLNRDISNKCLVLFNDTHGTGNQFIKQFSTLINTVGDYNCFIVCYSLHKQAFEKFKTMFPNITIIPEIATPSISDFSFFTNSELQMIWSLGRKVYASHPLGYSNCGLLVAYYFQCPNISLPIIWADGENNSYKTDTGEEKGYHWTPLFPYRSKKHFTKPNDELKKELLYYQKTILLVCEKLRLNPSEINKEDLKDYVNKFNSIIKFLKKNSNTLREFVNDHESNCSVDALRSSIRKLSIHLLVAMEAFEEIPIDYTMIYKEYIKAAELTENIKKSFLLEQR